MGAPLRPPLLMGSLLLLCLTSGCGQAGNTDFYATWDGVPDRVWAGSDFWANRLQDWRVHAGRLECVESRETFPVRTLHLLTRTLGPSRRPFVLEVRTAPVATGEAPATDGWSGLLIGVGGDHVDYRLSALAHHRPAEDGGLIAMVDAEGRVAFRDFSRGSEGGGLWSVGGRLGEEDAPLLPAAYEGEGFAGEPPGEVLLRLTGIPEGGAYRLRLQALAPDTGVEYSRAEAEGVEPELVNGGIALVSSGGAATGSEGYWFDDWKAGGAKVRTHPERAWGPLLGVQYTVSRGVLKLTAQTAPLGPDDIREAELQINRDGSWQTVDRAELVADSYTFPFRVAGWGPDRDVRFRVLLDLASRSGPQETAIDGTIRAEPEDPEFVLAAFTGHKIYTGGLKWNHEGIWFPHLEVLSAVRSHDPDLLFFSGDQVYEGDLTPAEYAPEERALLDYLYKWYRWVWAFGELTREIPAVTVPDDHDVYHGNIWGAEGRKAEAGEGITAQDGGGYRMSPRFVNAVHRTQTSHLPDPHDATPVQQGISVYYTDLVWGGVSFAVLADRQWKSSPTVAVPDGGFVNGWPQAEGFDPATEADAPDAVLLGERQLGFLEEWAADWSDGVWMKGVLSQTIFANVATLPAGARSGSVLPSLPTPERDEYPSGYHLASDADSNGWPPSGRNRALEIIRKAFAVHVAGDQHLGSTVQYGIDAWGDAPFALCVPSVGNTWPRRWFPAEPGLGWREGDPLYTGDYLDGFGNLMTVYAVSNPVRTGREPAGLHDRAPGYGIVRFDRDSRMISMENWPRWVDPSAPGAEPYDGWPVVFHQRENYGRRPVAWLPPVEVVGLEDPVFQVIDDSTGEHVYTIRIRGTSWQPHLFSAGRHTLHIGEPGTDRMRTFPGLPAAPEPDVPDTIVVRFP